MTNTKSTTTRPAATKLAAGLVAALLVGGALPGCAQCGHGGAAAAKAAGESGESEEDEQDLDVRDVVSEAKVSLADAIRAALAARPGTAIEAGLEGEIAAGVRQVFFEVMIRGTDGGVYEVQVDPASGRVSGVEAEKDPKDVGEIQAAAAAIPAGSKPLADLIRRAEEKTGARAVAVKIEVEKGQAGVEVTLLKGRQILEADVALASGDVISVDEEEEGDEEDEKGEKDEADEEDEKDEKRPERR